MSQPQKFRDYACEGDSIFWQQDGFAIQATVYHDDSGESPEEHSEGFWSSLDPKSAGYIGPKSKSTLRRKLAQERAILKAWQNDEWFYCGIAVTVHKNEVQLTGKYDHALWGIECNYPSKQIYPNRYLDEVAHELADEAIESAKAKLAQLAQLTQAA